jgi:serine/threonine protein kinase
MISTIVTEIRLFKKITDKMLSSFHILENKIDQTINYLLVMEYADSSTLRNYLNKNFDKLTWNNKYNMAYQLACSVLCLHDEGIVHRDLVILFKSNN